MQLHSHRQWPYICIHKVSSTTIQHIPCKGSWSRSDMGVMKMENTEPRVGLKPTSLALWASVLPLHHIHFPDVTTIPTPTCLCGHRDQSRLLQICSNKGQIMDRATCCEIVKLARANSLLDYYNLIYGCVHKFICNYKYRCIFVYDSADELPHFAGK